MRSRLIILIKELLGWMLAFICAVIVLNLFTFSFYHPAVELKRNGGATPGLMLPHQWSLLGLEGYGIQVIDKNGYVNPDLPLESEYYCVVGASHTEGLHSKRGERVSDYLNSYAGCTDTLKFYNIAHTAYQFNNIARHFNGIVQEFPDMKGLIIELDSSDFTIDQLTDALDQTSFSQDEDTIAALSSKLSGKSKAINAVKEYIPLLRELSFQMETYRKSKSHNTNDTVYRADEYNNESSEVTSSDTFLTEYRSALSDVMKMIRCEYSGPIIIVYHPTTSLDSEGNLIVNSEPTDSIFAEECQKNDITYIDMSKAFSDAYYNDHVAVYGFWNTTLMTGHINKYCHELMAEAVYNYLKETGIE